MVNFWFHTTEVRKDVWYDFNLLNLLRHAGGLTYDLSYKVVHTHLRRMWILLLLDEILCKSLKSTWSNKMSFLLHAYLENVLKYVHQLGNVQRDVMLWLNNVDAGERQRSERERERERARPSSGTMYMPWLAAPWAERCVSENSACKLELMAEEWQIQIRGDDQTKVDAMYCEVNKLVKQCRYVFPGENEAISVFG